MVSLIIGLLALACDIVSILPFISAGYLSIIGFILAIVAVATGGKIIKVDPNDKNARAGKAIGTVCIVLAVLAFLFKIVLIPVGCIAASCLL